MNNWLVYLLIAVLAAGVWWGMERGGLEARWEDAAARGEIAYGMPMSMVEQIWGAPDRTLQTMHSDPFQEDVIRLTWIWNDPPRRVVFNAGWRGIEWEGYVESFECSADGCIGTPIQ